MLGARPPAPATNERHGARRRRTTQGRLQRNEKEKEKKKKRAQSRTERAIRSVAASDSGPTGGRRASLQRRTYVLAFCERNVGRRSDGFDVRRGPSAPNGAERMASLLYVVGERACGMCTSSSQSTATSNDDLQVRQPFGRERPRVSETRERGGLSSVCDDPPAGMQWVWVAKSPKHAGNFSSRRRCPRFRD
ncbi:hypothetical protein BDY21DRAFT_108078 [Lineolata rhizophorae]|uniref:Uncharacterized protein n=1 Tax=Lineolata rhizophorae TaxID=578093 RepID=A0A6A6NR58_9PEZI|nr:hypothetical protein BDY21DRAFT_108078 [Lineolata rhizophorae]